MDNFKIIYRILKILEKAMDVEEFDQELISHTSLKISEPRWCKLMKMLVDEKNVSGVEVWNSMDCPYPKVAFVRPEITLKGLEYLESNGIMKKIAGAAKGIIEASI